MTGDRSKTGGAPLLAVEGLEVAYGEAQILWGASLDVREGGITALVGSNGAGKTTTLKAIAGLTAIRGGSVRFGGEPVQGLPSREVVARGISIVLEGGRIFPAMTVRENLEMGAYTPRGRARYAGTLAEVLALFPILGQRLHAAAGTLSGGERQMLAIGRGLMSQPSLLMLDEPSLGLAPAVVLKLYGVIRQLNARGIAILLVEQNVQHAIELAETTFVLESGRIALSGGRELKDNEHVRRAYLGL
jgi:branched-chain amino acid transport system ATP-binding protein